ncbi:MAG: TetR/AcrR family transcriptional regulator [Acidisphaera sp.]|nr:TetR/AcrR family transcriptional regulator [Acidisphaera sp.]
MVDTEALSPEKRAQILHGAAAVFDQDGYEGASMSRIAAEANVSKGTLYNHFTSKAHLFAAYVEQQCSRKLGHIFETIDGDDDPATTLRSVGTRMTQMMLSPTGLTIYRVVVSEAGKFPDLARVFFDAGPAKAIRQLSTWLERQARRGRLEVGDPQFAAEQFFALCQTRVWMRCKLHLLPPPSPAEIDRVVDAAVRMFLRFYAAEEVPA